MVWVGIVAGEKLGVQMAQAPTQIGDIEQAQIIRRFDGDARAEFINWIDAQRRHVRIAGKALQHRACERVQVQLRMPEQPADSLAPDGVA